MYTNKRAEFMKTGDTNIGRIAGTGLRLNDTIKPDHPPPPGSKNGSGCLVILFTFLDVSILLVVGVTNNAINTG